MKPKMWDMIVTTKWISYIIVDEKALASYTEKDWVRYDCKYCYGCIAMKQDSIMHIVSYDDWIAFVPVERLYFKK